MSNMTSVILSIGPEDDYETDTGDIVCPIMNTLNEKLVCPEIQGWRHPRPLVELDMDCWGAYINHLNVKNFFALLASLPWERPTWLQVLLKNEEDERFSAYTLNPDRTWAKT